MLQRALPATGSLRRLSFDLSDAAVFLGALVLLALVAKIGAGAFVSFVPPQTYGLSYWERFVKFEAPAGMIGLIWNALMSLDGGWFFLAASDAIGNGLRSLTRVRPKKAVATTRSFATERVCNAVLLAAVVVLVTVGIHFILTSLGLFTLSRVIVLPIFATIVWTPIGVAIGLSPKLARIAQPIALFFASFPANFIFPFATLGLIRYREPIDAGSILLMALGAQWYILFNSIAGAQSIPSDLREMAADCGLRGFKRSQRLIIPGRLLPRSPRRILSRSGSETAVRNRGRLGALRGALRVTSPMNNGSLWTNTPE